MLVYFKYANFFVENVNNALESLGFNELSWVNVALPIGISFYTFQTLSYAIDIYRGQAVPLKKLHNYLLFIMSFPQMIAGPIVRYNNIATQIVSRKEPFDEKLEGFFRFSIGLAKKVLIANIFAGYTNDVLELGVENITTTTAWVGILAYTFQIYFDFSGYSDMAIGLGKIMGFKFPENFDSPYTSMSITEFWRRWHITLSTWMRDYLYIPLGGNKKSIFLTYRNLILVFLLSGLWHGAMWSFIFWGAYHGLFLILDRLFLKAILAKLGKIPAVLITFFIVMIGWVFFWLEDINLGFYYIIKLFSFENSLTELEIDNQLIFTFIIAVIFSLFTLSMFGKKVEQKLLFPTKWSKGNYVLASLFGLIIYFYCTAEITTQDFNPFIYLRF